ncbi:MAG: HEPN domain-containing protein [Chloroflexota bacterium]
MRHDPALVEDTRAWLTKASMDLRAAGHLLGAAPPLLGDAVFHSQQAAEKALKAFLAWHDEPFRKTHNIEELGRQAVAFDATLQPMVDRAVGLTEYAWKYRYPGEPEEPARPEAEGALALAREVYEAVLSRLPQEVRP